MHRLPFAALALAATALAESANPLVNEARLPYNNVRNNFLKLADKMPADLYPFRPVPEIESFAQRIAHIAGANLAACNGLLTGNVQPVRPAPGSTKAELIAALKESFAACDKAFDATNDKNAFDQVSSRLGGPFPPEPTRSRLFALSNMVRHTNELYGYVCVYLRLKGIVPPSSSPE